nr:MULTISPECIES: VOC family protein [unclassified Streptomyces]
MHDHVVVAAGDDVDRAYLGQGGGIGLERLHLDVAVDEIDQGIAQVIALGGRFTGERHDYDEGVVVVMADPEGHEFCLVQYY